jgi:transcriptional regulator with XRE-family HTH domain
MREALFSRDVGGIFRLLVDAGMAQRQLAELVKMSQSEVSEILSGRRVMGYDVLVRIADGLGVPRGCMGLAYDEGAARELVGEVDDDMRRRALLAAAGVALFGAPVLGELLELPAPVTPTPLPSRLGASDVVAIRSLTESMRGVARTYGGCADMVTGVAHRSLPLMSVPATDTVRTQLGEALAELHIMAGWCCVDSGLHDHARANFATAMKLGGKDQVASALRHSGIQMIDAGVYNDGLKAYQLGLISAREPELVAWLHGESALPLAAMGQSNAALTSIKRARDERDLSAFDDADMDYLTASVYYRLGRLDTAEASARQSVDKWAEEGTTRRDSVGADIALAMIHTVAGQSDSAALARRAIAGVAPLRSLRARGHLTGLVRALDTRHDSTSRELAQQARGVCQRV